MNSMASYKLDGHVIKAATGLSFDNGEIVERDRDFISPNILYVDSGDVYELATDKGPVWLYVSPQSVKHLASRKQAEDYAING